MPSREALPETARKEVNMLLHLPIVILATLSPIAVSATLPKFDIVRECNVEGGPRGDVARCSRDEAAALRQLQEAWVPFAGADRKAVTFPIPLRRFPSPVYLLPLL